MTKPLTDEDLERILARAADPNETNLTPYWRITVRYLGAVLREAWRERDEALDDPITLLEGLAQKVSDSNGGFCSVDIPPPSQDAPPVADGWELLDYVAVRWHPEDGFDYQWGIGGDAEMDKRHVTRDKAMALLADRRAPRFDYQLGIIVKG